MKTTFRWILLGGSLLLSGASMSARPPGAEVRDLLRPARAWIPAPERVSGSAYERNSGRAAPQVTVHDVNPGATVERDLCLTVAMGAGAAAECGDLRLVHALPTVRTLNRARTPVLLYNSQHARPYALVAAHVTLPQGTAGLQRVTATLWVDDRPRARSTWKGDAWPGGGPARIALGYDAQSDATAMERFVLEVAAVYASATGEIADTTRTTGALAILNRKNSPFGPGWWLAGLEQLLLDPQGNPEVWVGGDGSVRRYAAVPGVKDRWAAPNVDRPDTLIRDGAGFVRLLPGGVRVRFDGRGRHVATINRLGHETTFAYPSEGRLDRLQTLTVPPAGSGLSYTFLYGADGRLERVDAPGVQAREDLHAAWSSPAAARN
ncbi:MAG: hypothetical protein M3P24_11615 [Gemmatimonadota bacterium]|nr:hypothetical protein [Gemmatimonadota bacterium]